MARTMTTNKHRIVEDPPVARLLFNDTRFSLVWLIVRLYLVLEWLPAGLHKLFVYKETAGDITGLAGVQWGVINQGWMGDGAALKGYWLNAIKMDPRPAITFDWYRSFLQFLVDTQSYVWFSKLIVFGEIAIGLGLLVGAFVGIAAFFGGLMNFSFLMAGTASTNPVLLILAVAVMLAWKTAGYYGLDRYLLPMLGTPWKPVEAENAGQVVVGNTPIKA